MYIDRETYCKIINQIHSIQSKIAQNDMEGNMKRKFARLKSIFEEMGIYYHNPIGEKYDDTRIDCEANIVGEQTEHLKIIEVIKPIIYERTDKSNTIIQRGIVLVEGTPNN